MINDILNKWLEETQKNLILNYDKLGLRASGDWADALKPFNKKVPNGFRIGMIGADYTEFLENGRRPNKDQSPEGLQKWAVSMIPIFERWIQQKGIDLNPFAVAYKIAKYGTKVPNNNNAGGLVTDVVNAKALQELSREMSLFIIGELKSNIIKNINNG